MSKFKRLKDISNRLFGKLTNHRYSTPTMGTDPEFFVADKKTGKILAADKFFPDKDHPMTIESLKADPRNKLFFDGIQAEINVTSATCRESVGYYVREGLRQAAQTIGKDNMIVVKPSVRVQKSVINAAKPEARIFGCMPDFNAYTRGTNTSEIDASNHPYRYAGGHIHVGVSSSYLKPGDREYNLAKTEEGHLEVIKFFDYVSGPILLLMDKSPESKRRRSLYGSAGCFRPTPYGIEYRTPSCWWLKSSAGMSLAFGMVRVAYNLLLANLSEEFKKAVGYTEDEVRAIINESDIVGAKKFWKAIRPYVAITGFGNSNPLHVKSVRTTGSGFLDDNTAWYNYIKNDKPLAFKGCNDKPGTVVHALAAFEYLVHNGSELLISDELATEWCFNSRDAHHAQNGWINQMYYKLAKDDKFTDIQADFQKFQTSFMQSTL